MGTHATVQRSIGMDTISETFLKRVIYNFNFDRGRVELLLCNKIKAAIFTG